jgi:Phosphotransferase enzyme family
VLAWTDPAWRAEADDWIGEHLGRLGLEPAGEPDQLHVRDWATVIRLPTSRGDVYFKATMPALRHEVALTEVLAARRPDCIPQLLASDRTRGWMLMEDGGTRLRDLITTESELRRWLDVLPLYASVQIDLTADTDELLALGVPDLRLTTLPGAIEALLGEITDVSGQERQRLETALPEVKEMCDELASAGIPETIQHDDFHDAQVYVRDDRYLLLDWGDACISHPFFSLAVTLDGVIAWGVDDVENSIATEPFRDAYLEPFRARTTSDLVALAQTARRLGWLCRAVNSRAWQTSDEGTLLRVRMFLDGRA